MLIESEELQRLMAVGIGSLANFDWLLQDIFCFFYRSRPTPYPDALLSSQTLINKHVINSLEKSPQNRALKSCTSGNIYGAAIAAVYCGEELLNFLPEELKKLANRLTALEEQIKNYRIRGKAILHMYRELKNSGHEAAAEVYRQAAVELGCIISVQRKLRNRLKEELLELLTGEADRGIPVETAAVRVRGKLVEAREGLCHFSVFGVRPGDIFENRQLVESYLKSPKLQRIARRLGRLKEISRLKGEANGSLRGLSGVEFGCDLERAVPDELCYLLNPRRRNIFLNRYREENLCLYEEREQEKGMGSIILCLDNSGSMQGPKEETAKALALALLETAVREGRDFAAINFGGAEDELQLYEFPAGQNDMERLLEFGQYFMGARGTDFEKPLREALQLMNKNRYCNGDIVFITDGVCSVSEGFLKNFLKQKETRGCRVFSVIVHYGSISTEGVEAFSDRVFFSKDLKGLDVVRELTGAFYNRLFP